MKFQDLCWSAMLFQYRSRNDRRYLTIMEDSDFIAKLREKPDTVGINEFEQKVILNYIMVCNYDLLLKHEFSHAILSAIVDLEPEFNYFKNISILDIDLSDNNVEAKLTNIFCRFCKIKGLQLLGVSKILHLMNDKLFSIITKDFTDQYRTSDYSSRPIKWLKQIQIDAKEIIDDFNKINTGSTVEEYLASKLGIGEKGFKKSIVKYIDEYYWIKTIDRLELPPNWIPSYEKNSRDGNEINAVEVKDYPEEAVLYMNKRINI